MQDIVNSTGLNDAKPIALFFAFLVSAWMRNKEEKTDKKLNAAKGGIENQTDAEMEKDKAGALDCDTFAHDVNNENVQSVSKNENEVNNENDIQSVNNTSKQETQKKEDTIGHIIQSLNDDIFHHSSIRLDITAVHKSTNDIKFLYWLLQHHPVTYEKNKLPLFHGAYAFLFFGPLGKTLFDRPGQFDYVAFMNGKLNSDMLFQTKRRTNTINSNTKSSIVAVADDDKDDDVPPSSMSRKQLKMKSSPTGKALTSMQLQIASLLKVVNQNNAHEKSSSSAIANNENEVNLRKMKQEHEMAEMHRIRLTGKLNDCQNQIPLLRKDLELNPNDSFAQTMLSRFENLRRKLLTELMQIIDRDEFSENVRHGGADVSLVQPRLDIDSIQQVPDDHVVSLVESTQANQLPQGNHFFSPGQQQFALNSYANLTGSQDGVNMGKSSKRKSMMNDNMPLPSSTTPLFQESSLDKQPRESRKRKS
jgi:hypothetical protein